MSNLVDLINVDAERSLIGAMLIQPAIIAEVRNLVRDDDFYTDRFRPILHAMCEMEGAGEIIDGVTVGNRLKLDGKGKNELLTLIQSCPSAANWEAYAEIVVEKARGRLGAVIARDLAEGKLSRTEAAEKLLKLEPAKPAVKTGFTLAELMATDFPDPAWLVEGLIPEVGLTVLAGSPKVGKSWFVFDLAARLATGRGAFLGCGMPAPGRVLYLALEDNWRRLKSRAAKLLKGSQAPDNLHMVIGWPRLDEGGAAELRVWLKEHPDTKLIIIDVLARVRQKTGRGNIYDEDYSAMEPLKMLADEHGIAVLVIHHTNQSQGRDNWMELISGSNGLIGTADAVMLLSKGGDGRADGRLRCSGRDLAEIDFALSFDDFIWQRLDGSVEDHMRSEPRQKIIDCLRRSDELLGPKEVAQRSGQDHEAVKKLMQKMEKQGEIVKLDYGKYTVPNKPSPSDPSGPSSEEAELLKSARGIEGIRGIGDRGNDNPKIPTCGHGFKHSWQLPGYKSWVCSVCEHSPTSKDVIWHSEAERHEAIREGEGGQNL